MKKLFVPALAVLCLQSAYAAEYTVNKITNNYPPFTEPAVMANGDVAWYSFDGSDLEVYVYRAQSKTLSQLTNNSVADSVGASNSHGDVLVFSQVGAPGDRVNSPQLSLYSGSDGTAHILGAGVVNADINERGDVVWSSYDGNDLEIFLCQSSTGTTTQLTDNSTDDLLTSWYQYLNLHAIDNNGNVTWIGNDGDKEIFLYTASTGTITQLTDNTLDDTNPTIGNGNVVWSGFDGTDTELFL